jgi:predicted small secreted protein
MTQFFLGIWIGFWLAIFVGQYVADQYKDSRVRALEHQMKIERLQMEVKRLQESQ